MAIKPGRWMAATVAVFALLDEPAQAGKVTKMSPPRINCGGATQASTYVQVCGGATGATAGFSVQWMTTADYAANASAWYLSDEARLCKASFSGRANGSRYDLGPGECVTVNAGDLLFDSGASTNCAVALMPSTDYVLRAFAHAACWAEPQRFHAQPLLLDAPRWAGGRVHLVPGLLEQRQSPGLCDQPRKRPLHRLASDKPHPGDGLLHRGTARFDTEDAGVQQRPSEPSPIN